MQSDIPHQFNNRGLLAATVFCRNFSKNMLNRNCLQKSKIKNRKSDKLGISLQQKATLIIIAKITKYLQTSRGPSLPFLFISLEFC